MLKAGTILGERYEIVGRVGSGGMADVYKAKDHKLNRFVAVKVMKPEFSEDSQFISKFRREAQAAAGLANPNIVNVYDVGEDGDNHYIVMELVEGITLKEYIGKKGQLSVREATSIAIQVCMGLQAAHAQKIVHRDVKPQNIIISTDGKVKVTDFGIARAASSNTISANAMGSVHYSSPEQVRGGYADSRSDIYSVGITLYEMVTGRVPFDGESTVAIAIKHLQDEMEPPSKFAPDLPYSLEQIIYKCTQKNVDRRYQTVGEVIEDLKHSLQDPNGHFVQLAPLSDHARTVIMTPAQQEAIRRGAQQKAQNDSDAAYYAAGAAAAGAAAAFAGSETAYAGNGAYPPDGSYPPDGVPEPYDEGGYEEPAPEEEPYPEDEDDGGSSGLEKAVTIGGFVVAAAIIVVLIYFIGRAAGLFNFGGGSTTSSDAVVTTAPTETPTVAPASSTTSAVESSTTSSVESSTTTSSTESAEPTPVPMVEVPQIVGMSEVDARTAAQERNLSLRYISERMDNNSAAGVVLEQDPVPGTQVEEGSEISYVRSLGPEQKYVPNVINLTVEEAQKVMSENGFTNIHFSYQPNPVFEYGRVCATSPSVGSPEEVSTLITCYVSVGSTNPTEPTAAPEPTEAPQSEQVSIRNYTGIPLEESIAAITADGLTYTVQEVTRDGFGDGIVLEQSLPPQSQVDRGSNILILVNRVSAQPAPEQPSEQPAEQPSEQPAQTGGRWVANTVLESNGSYTGGHYILNIVQYVGNDRVEKQISEGDGLGFPMNFTAEGAEGVPDGQIVLYELRDGAYTPVQVWDGIPFNPS